MTPAEEAEAITAIRAATGPCADRLRRDFLRRYEPVVKAWARRLAYVDLDYDDRLQEGQVGLSEALARYEPRGVAFAAYAKWRIFRSILRAGERAGRRVVRVPSGVHARLQRAAKAERALAVAYQRQPTLDEIAAACGLTPKAVARARGAFPTITSLAPTPGQRPLEIAAPGIPADATLDLSAVRKAIETLPERHRLVIRGRFGFDGSEQSHHAIGLCLGVSRETVRALEADGIARIRSALAGRPVVDAACSCGCGRPVKGTDAAGRAVRYARGHAPRRERRAA